MIYLSPPTGWLCWPITLYLCSRHRENCSLPFRFESSAAFKKQTRHLWVNGSRCPLGRVSRPFLQKDYISYAHRVSNFGIAFQCNIPNTWAIASDKCFNQPAFWTFAEILNGLTDLGLVGILCLVVTNLQLAKSKFMLLCVFTARSL